MPEPESDKFRDSPSMPTGLSKGAYPKKPYFYMTDDEAYQFREPDKAYNDGSQKQDFPDGLRTDGSHPRKWGETVEMEKEKP